MGYARVAPGATHTPRNTPRTFALPLRTRGAHDTQVAHPERSDQCLAPHDALASCAMSTDSRTVHHAERTPRCARITREVHLSGPLPLAYVLLFLD